MTTTTMTREELKEVVLQCMTPDEVKAFGDKRLKATWQAAYDSLTVNQMVEGTLGLCSEDSTKESSPNYSHLFWTVVLLIVFIVYYTYYTVTLKVLPFVVLLYHRAKAVTTRLLDDLSYSLFRLILDY